MKTIILLFLSLSILSLDARLSTVSSDCTVKGKKLYGRVMIVESAEDLRVLEVSQAPDVRVQVVTQAPNRCGQWMLVEFLPDVRIKMVEFLPDVHVQFVDNFPGLN